MINATYIPPKETFHLPQERGAFSYTVLAYLFSQNKPHLLKTLGILRYGLRTRHLGSRKALVTADFVQEVAPFVSIGKLRRHIKELEALGLVKVIQKEGNKPAVVYLYSKTECITKIRKTYGLETLEILGKTRTGKKKNMKRSDKVRQEVEKLVEALQNDSVSCVSFPVSVLSSMTSKEFTLNLFSSRLHPTLQRQRRVLRRSKDKEQKSLYNARLESLIISKQKVSSLHEAKWSCEEAETYNGFEIDPGLTAVANYNKVRVPVPLTSKTIATYFNIPLGRAKHYRNEARRKGLIYVARKQEFRPDLPTDLTIASQIVSQEGRGGACYLTKSGVVQVEYAAEIDVRDRVIELFKTTKKKLNPKQDRILSFFGMDAQRNPLSFEINYCQGKGMQEVQSDCAPVYVYKNQQERRTRYDSKVQSDLNQQERQDFARNHPVLQFQIVDGRMTIVPLEFGSTEEKEAIKAHKALRKAFPTKRMTAYQEVREARQRLADVYGGEIPSEVLEAMQKESREARKRRGWAFRRQAGPRM